MFVDSSETVPVRDSIRDAIAKRRRSNVAVLRCVLDAAPSSYRGRAALFLFALLLIIHPFRRGFIIRHGTRRREGWCKVRSSLMNEGLTREGWWFGVIIQIEIIVPPPPFPPVFASAVFTACALGFLPMPLCKFNDVNSFIDTLCIHAFFVYAHSR